MIILRRRPVPQPGGGAAIARLIIATGLLAGACSTGPLVSPTGAPTPAGASVTPASPAQTGSPTVATSAPPTTRPEPTATPDPLADRTLAELAVVGGPDFPLEAFGSLWLLTPDVHRQEGPTVSRLNPETNEVEATIAIDGQLCQALGATDDAIWACGREGLVRIDPASSEVVATVELPIAQVFTYLPFADGWLWALGGEVTHANVLAQIDPIANEVVQTYALDFDAEFLSHGDGALWISDTAGGKLWRFDLATGSLTEHVTGLADPVASAVGAGSVWLLVNAARESAPSADEPTVLRVDPESGEIEASIILGGSMWEASIYASDETVWVRAGRPFLAQIDPRTNEVSTIIEANYAGGSVTTAFGSLWVTSFAFDRVWRLEP